MLHVPVRSHDDDAGAGDDVVVVPPTAGEEVPHVMPALPDPAFCDQVDGSESMTVYFPALMVTEGFAVQ